MPSRHAAPHVALFQVPSSTAFVRAV
jgi:hypothetical protein